MVFVTNRPFFLFFFFLGLVGQENLFYTLGRCVYDILETRKAFLGYKNESSKSANIKIFPKKLVHGFGQKLAIFPFYYSRSCWPGKCLLRYSKTKKTFLGFKNEKF